MSYLASIRELSADAEPLERLYQWAVQAGEAGAFAEAVNTLQAETPDNLLFAAWRYRLAYAAGQVKERAIAWAWVIPLAVLNGLLLWLLSQDRFSVQVNDANVMPGVFLAAGPVSAVFIILYLALAGAGRWRRLAVLAAGIVALTLYAYLLYPGMIPFAFQTQYVTLASIHLPLAAITAIGLYLLWRQRTADDRFAFLIKCLEVIILGGLFGIALGIFTAITFALFEALRISPPDLVVRLFVAGGGGLIPVLAVAILYDPRQPPGQQSFGEGLSKLIAMLMRILLAPTVLVLLIYLAFIPFNFRQPFQNRDVLITYNIMLFAVMALLAGATPVREAEPGGRVQRWLRWGVIAAAILALVVGIYAFAAIAYRTAIDKWTPNRIAFMGWNLINIGILTLLLLRQARGARDGWMERLRATFATAMIPYAVWSIAVLILLPWLSRPNPQTIQSLPPSIREIAYEQAPPILLKCAGSPHIYLLEDGKKRWVKDIPTFQAQGYTWDDVELTSCADLRTLTDGRPIPPDAGAPPQP
ncbi:MAG: hypothetical protein K1X65_16425 [Caldilineales bacterium]|nr:hypothetical protein [Caldilineales bacterium]MCW5858981.1 hypothetical protein [Caldilineales bacterium]